MSLKEGVNIELQQQQDITFMSFHLAGCVGRFKLDVDLKILEYIDIDEVCSLNMFHLRRKMGCKNEN